MGRSIVRDPDPTTSTLALWDFLVYCLLLLFVVGVPVCFVGSAVIFVVKLVPMMIYLYVLVILVISLGER